MVKKYGLVGAFLNRRIVAVIAEQYVFNLGVTIFHHTVGGHKGIFPRPEFFTDVFPVFRLGFVEFDRRAADGLRYFALTPIFALVYGA